VAKLGAERELARGRPQPRTVPGPYPCECTSLLTSLVSVAGAVALSFLNQKCTVKFPISVDGLLYGVTGATGVLTPQGFTIDLVEDERYSVDLIAMWSPDDKVRLHHRLPLKLRHSDVTVV